MFFSPFFVVTDYSMTIYMFAFLDDMTLPALCLFLHEKEWFCAFWIKFISLVMFIWTMWISGYDLAFLTKIRFVLFDVRNINDSFSIYNSKFSTRTNIEVIKPLNIWFNVGTEASVTTSTQIEIIFCKPRILRRCLLKTI